MNRPALEAGLLRMRADAAGFPSTTRARVTRFRRFRCASTAPGLSNSRQSLRSITSGGKALTGDRLYTERPRSAQCLAANLKDGSITRAKCRANRLL